MKTVKMLKVLITFCFMVCAVPIMAQDWFEESFYTVMNSPKYDELVKMNLSYYRVNTRNLARIIGYLDDVPNRKVELKLRNREFRKMAVYFASDNEFSGAKLTTVVLLCWHWGTKKFLQSDFYQALQKKHEWQSANKCLAVTAESEKEKKYLWIIDAIWHGKLSFDDFYQFPHQSYLKLDADKIYPNGEFYFGTAVLRILRQN